MDISPLIQTIDAAFTTFSILAVLVMGIVIYRRVQRTKQFPHQSANQPERYQPWLEAILDGVRDAVITTNADGSILFLNPMAEALTGWPEQEAKHHSIQEVFRTLNTPTGDFNPCPVKATLQLDATQNLTGETRLQHRDGSTLPITYRSIPVFTETGSLQGAIVVFQTIMMCDSTDAEIERVLSKEKELSDLKSSFISMISHDIRTPLTIILSSTDLLQYHGDKVTVEKKEQYFHQIRSAVQRLQELLDDVLLIR